MAERFLNLDGSPSESRGTSDRITALLQTLEHMAGGDTSVRLPISDAHDDLDALAHGINVLIGELAWATASMLQTQRERVEALQAAVAVAERANTSKSVFLRNVSHEIRTPIAAMLSFAELLSSAGSSEEDRADCLHRLQVNGRAVLALLGDLLDLARLDEHKLVTAPESVPVVQVVHEVCASVEVATRAKGLQVRVDAGSDATGDIRTDRHRFRQILANLVGNAVKFTDTGSIVISLRVARGDDGDTWTIDVADTGIGISKDRQPYIFAPFEQAHPSIDQRLGGSGLGLALSRRLAERLGGSLVLLDSAPGAGTTFRLTLQALTDAAESESQPASRAPSLSLEGVRVLLVEDHGDMRLALRRLLEQEGASVDAAGDGFEAAEKAAAAAFDVVLMDLHMPRMDGYQATRELRSAGCRAAIVAITADSAAVHRADVLAVGCDACLSKPFTIAELIESIPSLRHRLRA